MRGRTGDGDCAGRCIIHIKHTGCCRAGYFLCGAQQISIAGLNRDGFADLRLCQGQCCSRCASNGGAVRQPLITDSSQAIDIGERVRCC